MCTQQKISSPDRRDKSCCPAKECVRREELKYFEWTYECRSVRWKEVSVKEYEVGDA